jgi:hypothetical protein
LELKCKIFKSAPSEREQSAPRFKKQSDIQSSLGKICKKWAVYLERYVDQTADLFQKSEFPWEDSERAVISTLSASISQSFRDSLVLEEYSVEKGSNPGRCDLWATIPELNVAGFPLSFYLEAKKSRVEQSEETLPDFLKSDYGISKLFRDYAKGKPNNLNQRSTYARLRSRRHEHYVIGMLITKLRRNVLEPIRIKIVLEEIFKGILPFELKSIRGETPKMKRRRLDRFPTVALIVIPNESERPGMVAIFTVLGSTQKLSGQAL